MTDPDTADLDTVIWSLEEVQAFALRFFSDLGCDQRVAEVMARLIRDAERDGRHSHGMAMLVNYGKSLKSRWVDGSAQATWHWTRPAVLSVDGANGFAQPALVACRQELAAAARRQGIAVLALSNAHHIGALRSDVEPYAEEGLIALAMVNSRTWVVPWGGERPVFGTDPMAFAAPRPIGGPIVWDQAASVIAVSDIKLAAERGETFEQPVGLSSDGQPSADPKEVLESKALLTFGQHKGTAIALMVEILAGAFTGGKYGFENPDHSDQSIGSGNTGLFMMVLDPQASGRESAGFEARLLPLLQTLAANGEARIPGDGRFGRRALADRDGVAIPHRLLRLLEGFQEH